MGNWKSQPYIIDEYDSQDEFEDAESRQSSDSQLSEHEQNPKRDHSSENRQISENQHVGVILEKSENQQISAGIVIYLFISSFYSFSFVCSFVHLFIPCGGPIELFLVPTSAPHWCNMGHGLCYPSVEWWQRVFSLAFAHGAMGRWIDPSWGEPIELFLVPTSAP